MGDTVIPIVKWMGDIGREDVPTVGGKGANLGEMLRAGVPVPDGFVVTVGGYDLMMNQEGLRDRIAAELSGLDAADPGDIERRSARIQSLVLDAPFPDAVRAEIVSAYAKLRSADDTIAVAVRSSGTAEDSAAASFAGMFRTILGAHDVDSVCTAVQECWASGFGARLLYYSATRNLASSVGIAVVVQRLVEADASGVVFTVDPSSGSERVVVIEATFGLGEPLVSGAITPDHYEWSRQSQQLSALRVATKAFKTIRAAGGNTSNVALSPQEASSRVLSDSQVSQVAEYALKLEKHYGLPQDCEFVVVDGVVTFVQTRPITTGRAGSVTPASSQVTGRTLLKGLPAGPGVATGAVRVLSSPAEADRLQKGDILVAPMTSPDWVPYMRRAVAVVTDSGGMTSHAAIVSRELGIPCVVGTHEATTLLRDGAIVTVNGNTGTVTEGGSVGHGMNAVVLSSPIHPTEQPRTERRPAELVTATRLYVNLADPGQAETVAGQNVDGVGLLRAEFMLVEALGGVHPNVLIADGRRGEIVSRLTERIGTFARAFAPRPVVYRAADFRSNEFRALRGGDVHEPQEANPMIGYRGCYRYVRSPELFQVELEALGEVRKTYGNVHLMIPFVRTGWELAACVKEVRSSGLDRDAGFELWVMAEVPSVVTWLPDYAAMGVRGVSIGSNDLTQLVLGVDRDSEICAPLYDERDKAVQSMVATIITECQRLGLHSSICGQAPSVHAEYIDFLVRCGVDSISVNVDAIESARRLVASAEARLSLDVARRILRKQGEVAA